MAPDPFVRLRRSVEKAFRLIERASEDDPWQRALWWAALVAFALVATLLATMSFQQIPTNLREGMIASHNIKADRNYEIVDAEATQKFKDEALSGVLSVYDQDELVLDAILKRLHEAFAAARDRLGAMPAPDPKKGRSAGVDEGARRDLEDAFAEKLGVAPTLAMWESLWEERFDERMEGQVGGLLRNAMGRPVVAERGTLDAEKGRGVVVRHLVSEPKEGGERLSEEKALSDVGQILSTEEARRLIGEMPVPSVGLRAPKAPATIVALSQLLVEPNCSINRPETERRREEASANVKNVILKVNAGEMIIREGARFEPWHLKVLRAIQEEKRRGMSAVEFLGTFALILLFLVVPFTLLQRYFRRGHVSRADEVLMAAVGLSLLAIMRLSLMLVPAIHEAVLMNVPASALTYAIPVAGGAMLLRMFLGAEATAVFAVVQGALAGFFVEAGIGFVTYSLLASFTAIIAIADADRRSLIIRAGVITGIVGALAVGGAQLIAMASATQAATAADLFWGVFCAFLGGVGSAIFTMIAAPLVESFSNYTSDIKLLELANLNHPLLRELIVRAPGTYHHSHMAGILGEAAAEAIGAKALLVRVGAYYHDIGKIKKPSYFIENAKAGENKHERLSPHMSALIVAAHVKDGMEMAQRAGVPRAIARMIPEHHGTRLMSFFYEKAKEQEDASVQRVEEKEFRYPGPKPQTREAAILMLADATEAAVRALKEKSTTRIQQTVQRVITDIFMEKQLDECELTLKDLNEIARAFMRTLLGIYHARIEYPRDADHEREKPEISIVDESSTSVDVGVEPPPPAKGAPGVH